MSLETYQQKRDFTKTPEPRGAVSKHNKNRFVVQEHHASSLHFDFRLEIGGVLKSWSIRKGPSLDPKEKRLAVETEDHPVEYLTFQGRIPEGNYGAGEHMIWDSGRYKLIEGESVEAQFEAGKLKFELKGKKIKGKFNFFRLASRKNQWLLIKISDEFAQENWQLELLMPDETGSKTVKEKRSQQPVKMIKAKTDAETVSAKQAFKNKNLTGNLNVKIKEAVLALTNLDKVYWSEEGFTKGDLIRYYYEISEYILPYLKNRPLIMKRYPNGIGGKFFHQHDVNEVPEFVHTESLEVEENGGHFVDYIIGDNLPTLLYMANLGAIERHPWHSRLKNLDKPDWFVFDLDPSEDVEFETICDIAVATRNVLEKFGLQSYAKTSGSRGIHVYVPIKPVYSYEEVAKSAEKIATIVARENPQDATIERSIKNRKKTQIYIDHMQNARGKSVVAPYSVRPKAGATVSAPLDWKEVESGKIRLQDFTIKTMLARLKQKGDLFAEILTNQQEIKTIL